IGGEEDRGQGIVEGYALIHDQVPDLLVVQFLVRQLADPATEEIEATARHHLEQQLIAFYFLHLGPILPQDLYIEPALALAESKLLQLIQSGGAGDGCMLLGADEADAVADDPEMDGETNIVDPRHVTV